jgi:hypothetical protein
LKGQLDLQEPGVVAGFGSYRVVKGAKVQFHGLLSKVKRLAEAAADRDGPLAAAPDPARRDLRRRADGPSVGEMIIDERVQKKLVGPVAVAGRAANGPNVIDDRTEPPRALILLDEGRRRSGTPFLDADRRVRLRIVEDRPDAPVKTLAVLRRQKECGISIGQSGGPVVAELFRRLHLDRQFGARD